MTHHRLAKLARFVLIAAMGLLITGCATAPAALGPLSGIKEIKTRADVQRQAARDPFPSPGEVGLQ